MKKHTALKTGLLTVALLMLAALPFSGAAMAQSQKPVAAPVQVTRQAPEGNSGMLKWGVFLFALGEVGGTLGMGFSHMRQQKRQEKAKTQELPLPVPMRVNA